MSGDCWVGNNATMAEIKPENCASYSEIKQGAEDGTLLVTDVRNPTELEGGRIESKRWINVPLPEVGEAFKLSEEDFEKKYKGKKPACDGSDLIINCGTGRRSARALEIVLKMGYSKARHYPGGYNNWKTEAKE